MLNNDFRYIKSSYLLGLYIICPILIVITLIDITILNGSILEGLPNQPEDWGWWLIIFNLPHILSSFLTLADSENIKIYRFRLISSFTVLSAISILFNGFFPSLLSDIALYYYQLAFFALYAFLTTYHVLSQQFGICLILGRFRPDTNFKCFKYILIILTFLIYIITFLGEQLLAEGRVLIYLKFGCVVLMILGGYFCYRAVSVSKTNVGSVYIVANFFMIAAILLFSYCEYFIFALIIPRFIHDITAFIIYSNHDANKFNKTKGNYVYKLLGRVPLPVFFISPCVGILCAYVINLSPLWFLVYLILVLDFLHYYLEGFVWKSGGVHRDYLRIS
jgi:hypothetical protein